MRMNVLHICTGHLWLLSSSNVGSTTKEMQLKLFVMILCHTAWPVGFTKRVLNLGPRVLTPGTPGNSWDLNSTFTVSSLHTGQHRSQRPLRASQGWAGRWGSPVGSGSGLDTSSWATLAGSWKASRGVSSPSAWLGQDMKLGARGPGHLASGEESLPPAHKSFE